MSGAKIGILMLALAALFAILVQAAYSMLMEGPNMWVAGLYNALGPYIAPNQVTVVLFDWRGFDTLGECMVLGTAVMVAALLFGRGALQLRSPAQAEAEPELEEDEEVNIPHSSVILNLFGYPIIIVLLAYSIVITLGGDSSPGGGFQAGAIFASACLLGAAIYGLKATPIASSQSVFHKFATMGILIFLVLGLAGMVFTGYYLFDIGPNLPYLSQVDIVTEYPFAALSPLVTNLFNYPAPADAPYMGPGILPYIDIGVYFLVSGSLSTVVLVLLGARGR